MEIIIRDRNKRYKQFRHRSGVEETMRREWGTQGMSDEQVDRLKWIEKKSDMNHSSIRSHVVDEVLPDKK
jgi:hypothetical protein